MTSASNPNANQIPELPLYDATNHQLVAWQADPTTVQTDTSVIPNITYAKAATTGGAGGGGGAVPDVVATGTITALNGVIKATFGSGVASWLVDARGTFSAGTTLIFEFSEDNVNFIPAYGVPVGSTSDVAVNSVAGGAPITYQGNGAGFQYFQVRANPFQVADNVSIKIVGSVATDGGFVSKSLPPGTNSIGKAGMQVGGSDVSVANPIPTSVQHGNTVSTVNSTVTPLSANGVFTGTGESSLSYSAISVEVFTDQASAANGLQIQQSQDNTNWDTTDNFTIAASTPFSTIINLVGQYFRIKYTNGATLQGTFRLQVIKQAAEAVMPRSLTALGNLKTAIQEALPAGTSLIGAIMRSSVAVYTLASTQSVGSTQNSGDLVVGPYTEISLDINTTAQSGTSPTLQLFYERKGADGIYYVLWQSNVLTAAANTLSTSIGAGMAYNQSLGSTGRLRWVVGGSSTPTYTFSANITGK